MSITSLAMSGSLKRPSSDHDAGSLRDSSPPRHSPRRREQSKPRTGLIQSFKNFIHGDTESADDELVDSRADRCNAKTDNQRDMTIERDEIIAKQRRTIESLARRMQDRDDTIQQQQCRISELEQGLGQQSRFQSRLQRTIEEFESEVSSLRSHLEKSQRNEQQLESQIREFQVRAFDKMNVDTWTSGDDSTVGQDLEHLQSRIKGWARKHALEEMNNIGDLNPNEAAALSSALGDVADIAAPGDFMAYLKSPHMNKKSPTICLQALLVSCIYSRIIEHPFYLFGRDADETLQNVYNDMCSGKSFNLIPECSDHSANI